MLVSYNWLKEYLEGIPEVNELKSVLNTRAFEIEAVEEKGDDYLIDIDVLPNRAHDCLSHYGIAKEISVLTSANFKEIQIEGKKDVFRTSFGINNKHDKCFRYLLREINNIEVKESPKEIKEKIEILGERSINNVVDVLNIVMFELGQPLHAFDKGALVGNIIDIRSSREDERIETLDGKEVDLDDNTLVIADEQGPLAIGGIKGGKRAEVDEGTTSIILESANFSSSLIRKTSQKINIKTESSKRFENGLTPELALFGMERVTDLLLRYCSSEDTEVSEIVDNYTKEPGTYYLGVSSNEVREVLGVEISDEEIEEIFERLDFDYEFVKTKELVLSEIKDFIGRPYQLGASISYDAPNSFDCSSLTGYLYALGGVSLPRMSVDQYVYGKEIDKEDLEAGDLVFSNSHDGDVFSETQEYLKGREVPEGVDHVGMYIGDGEIIHATRYQGSVVKEKLEGSDQFKDIVGYRRVIKKDEERYVIKVPSNRLDLRIKEDLIEEIGRIYGYEKIEEEEMSDLDKEVRINKEYYYNNKIRKILADIGFSEVLTSTFRKQGSMEVKKSFADDRNFLRDSLSSGLEDSLERNLKNSPLIGVQDIKIFEIGKVFSDGKESLRICIASDKEENTKEAIKVLNDESGLKVEGNINSGLIEIVLDDLYESAGEPDDYEKFDKPENEVYKIISQYPFVLRDIAVWVPENTSEDELLKIIKNESGELLVNSKLFDTYEKDDKISYAFQLVFQSYEKTLTDEEINKIMDKVTNSLNSNNGFEVR